MTTDQNKQFQAWLYQGLQLMREELASYRVDAKTREFLDRAIVEPNAADESALPFFPGSREARVVALTSAIRALSNAITDIPPDVIHQMGRPGLRGLPEISETIDIIVGSVLRKRAANKFKGLYVIIDPEHVGGRDPLWVAEQVMLGGATAIQLRDKRHDKGDYLQLAKHLVQLCNTHSATCIINDHADMAVAANAHGAHFGQHDLPLEAGRATLRPWQLVGTSNALVNEAVASSIKGADYIAVGAMFPSSSKDNTRPAGPETLRQVRDAIPHNGPPLVAIGGITMLNVAEVAKAGADGICVISAVTLTPEPRIAARRLLTAFKEAQK